MSNQRDMVQFGRAWWTEIAKKVKNASVFLDTVSCECLHWSGGLSLLFDAGATSVKEFSSFETVPKKAKKAVFIISSAIHGTNLRILDSLIKGSSLEYCVVITSTSASVHHHLQWGGGKEGHEMEAFQRIEEHVLLSMGNLNYTAEIFHFPFSVISPAHGLFLLPSSASLHPLLQTSLSYINEQILLFSKGDAHMLNSTNELNFASLPIELQGQVRHLINNIHQLLQHMDAKEDIFTIGDYSRILGTELESLNAARARRKTAAKKVSVIFVDRTLDLVSATNFNSGNLYDHIFHTLLKLHENSNDVAVNMTEKAEIDIFTPSGCLAPPTFGRGSPKLMDILFYNNTKQGMEHLKSTLFKADGAEEKNIGTVVEKRLKDWQFVENNCHLIQVAQAAHNSEQSERAQHIENLLNIQKNLLQLLGDPNAPSPLISIIQIIKTRKELFVTLDDIIVLLINLYSLEGNNQTFPVEIEGRLSNMLAEAILEDGEQLSMSFQSFVGVPVDELKAHFAARKLLEQLRSIGTARSTMKKYCSLYQKPNPALPLQYRSLFKQVVEDIFDSSNTENPDIEHKSGGLKDFLKTGISLFVNVRKPKPSDNPLILIYVCGGIRADEVKYIHELIGEKAPTHEVMVGSSHLITAHDMTFYALQK